MGFSSRWTGRLRWWQVYLVLLALSHVVQLARAPARPPGKTDGSVVEVVRQEASGPRNGPPVRIAYRDAGAGEPIIYLHGSPGSGADSASMVSWISREFRVLAPDLPGFGSSSRRVPDYGIEAHARYVLAFMDALSIDRAHLFGHSMGSAVALFVTHLAPERVASIVSYAGVGIQEGEGSGDYHFEHFKYAVGYAALVVAPEFVPHFGLLGPRSARHAFIRNFWDTDQRPLRGILERLETPLLILHGRDDPLVPAWTAREHHRIVEHSELVMLDASHFLVFSEDGSRRLADEILPFLRRHAVPGSVAVRRTVDHTSAPRDRAVLPSELRLGRELGPWTQIALLAAATFVSEDLTCISAGLLARQEQLDLFVAVLGSFLGIFASDIGLWIAGRALGRRALRWRWIARRLPPGRVDRFGRTFDRHLGKAVVASRFLPGTRVATYVTAGAVSRRPWAFAAWLFLAALVWTPLLVVLAMVFGPVVARPFQAVLGTGFFPWVATAIALFVLLRVALMALSWRGRVRLVATVSKLWRSEFWPVWLFYLPVIPWLVFLSVRHRGLTTPTVANPAMPHGGFVGESKYEILRRLPAEWIVPSHLAAPGPKAARLAGLRRQIEESGWTFPLVLKPDEGQRGIGLKLAHDWTETEAYLDRNPRAILVQPYDPGPLEAGIFYCRMPREPKGRIFSITDKQFPVVTGDGRSTLEELVLRHPRLRMQAATFARRHAARWERIVADSETIRLAVAGNHCQGTMFRDGSHLLTPSLEQAVDAIARQFEGFYFGRFDVRYGEAEALEAGRDFRIVELNGVTSESTNIYDPAIGLVAAYRTLFRQWSLAFRIGEANRLRGFRTSSPTALIRAAFEHYRLRPADRIAD